MYDYAKLGKYAYMENLLVISGRSLAPEMI